MHVAWGGKRKQLMRDWRNSPRPPPPGPTPSGLDDFQQTAQRWLKECEASASVARQHAENASEFARRANVSAGQAAKRAESIKNAAHREIADSSGSAGPPQPFVTELKFEIGQLQSQFRDLNQEVGRKVNEFVDLVSDVKIDTCNRLDDLDGKLARHSATGSSPKGGPSMDGLEADMQHFRDELNDVWGRMEADAEAYDYLDERLTRLENNMTPGLGEWGPWDNSRPLGQTAPVPDSNPHVKEMVPGMETVGQNGLRGLKLGVALGMIGPPTGIGVAVGIAYVVSGMVITIEPSGVLIPLRA